MPFNNFFTKHIYELMESANGRHRKAGAPAPGDPRARAGGLAGTTGAAVASARARERAIAIARERARIDALKAQQAAAAAAPPGGVISSVLMPAPGSWGWFTTAAGAKLPTPGELSKHIPNAGLTVGEIMAHRVWRIDSDCRLHSAHMPNLWLPGEPMVGDVNEHGVYAFKDLPNDVYNAAVAYGRVPAVVSFVGDDRRQLPPAMAIGRVKLWGTVVEHECGYRAEFAIPHAIDRVIVLDRLEPDYSDDFLTIQLRDKLRAIYGVTP